MSSYAVTITATATVEYYHCEDEGEAQFLALQDFHDGAFDFDAINTRVEELPYDDLDDDFEIEELGMEPYDIRE